MTAELPTKKASGCLGDHRAPSPAGLLRFYPLAQAPIMRFFALNEEKASLGRAETCRIRLEDDEVSRQHAFIEASGTSWTLWDNDSSNGVFVNGQQTRRHALQAGDVVRLGSTFFRFLAAGQTVATVDRDFPLEDSLLVGGPGIELIRRLLNRYASSDLTVLLGGETGTGKEIAAQYLHQASARRQGPLVAINCAAIPAPLFESQLFGHVRGAFTDARGESPGLIRRAEGGTLFLDEIGELPLVLQPKLLRVIQERRVLPVGGNQSIPADVRVICATNQDLLALIHQGRFREDLFARINGLTLTMPALRQRVEDIPLLAQYFIKKHTARAHTISVPALELLCQQTWPRNVRQLETAIQRALVLVEEEPVLLPKHFEAVCDAPTTAVSSSPSPKAKAAIAPQSTDPMALRVYDALSKHDGNAKLAAQELGISRSQFYRWVKKWKVDLDAFRKPKTTSSWS
jgi:transcriptional regulator with PAS, ATPase and Fis domain